jgi:L-glyceraldehyde 3-phosphate reductase
MTSALIGASSVRQLESSFAAVTAPKLTAAELAEIDKHAIDGLVRG